MSPKKKSIGYFWRDVIQAVEESKFSSSRSIYIHRQKNDPAKLPQARSCYYYQLNEKEKISFTQREVQTMELLQKNFTVPRAAKHLGLSTRTVEFYVKNARHKLACSSKKTLVNFLTQYRLLEKLTN